MGIDRETTTLQGAETIVSALPHSVSTGYVTQARGTEILYI